MCVCVCLRPRNIFLICVCQLLWRKCVYMLNICAVINSWTQDVFWTSYVRSIYLMCLPWSIYVKHVSPFSTRTHFSEIISWKSNWVNNFRSNDCIKFRVFQGHFSTRQFPELQNLPHLTYVCRNFSFSTTCPHFRKTLKQAAANIFSYFSHIPNKVKTY